MSIVLTGKISPFTILPMIPILNKAALAVALFALFSRAKSAHNESLKDFINFSKIWYFAALFWLASTFFIYAQSLAMPLNWYLENDRVRLKIFICLSILGLEAYSLFLFTKWRLAKIQLENTSLRTLVRLSFIELILTAILTIISLI